MRLARAPSCVDDLDRGGSTARRRRILSLTPRVDVGDDTRARGVVVIVDDVLGAVARARRRRR
jgi:hypothetical protein